LPAILYGHFTQTIYRNRPITLLRGYFSGYSKAASEAAEARVAAAAAAAAETRRYGLMDSARHVMGYHLTQGTRVQNAFNDMASTI
jgi:hypothetical protein